MTFFNKKTEVMNMEMTPYGRYLYSIGKFKPKYYEFVDDDILYRASGSGEAQEEAHSRIVNETPKIKTTPLIKKAAAFTNSIIIDEGQEMVYKMDLNQPGLFAMGRSSYSSDKYPNFQVSMMRGEISGSKMVYELNSSNSFGESSISGNVFIPQIDIDWNFTVSKVDPFDNDGVEYEITDVLEDGSILGLSYDSPIIYIREFSSFYEKENYDLEFFEVVENNTLNKLRIYGQASDLDEKFIGYFFYILKDEAIPDQELCDLGGIEIINQFLDKKLECSEGRTERFNIYSSNIGPDDLEDC